ncbi:MAG: AsmA-like C-terminal region-containing protein [Flavobacteriales bacterium]
MEKSTLIKILKRTVIGLGVFFLLLIGSGVTLVYVYEDELKQLAVKELNNYLDAPVKIAQIDFTIWDKFPNASLRFSDVFIPDLLEETGSDTLIFAKSVYLNFNVWQILKGDYTVKDIQVEQAIAHLKIDEAGRENYVFWKSDSAQTSQAQFKFELKQVALYDAVVSLHIASSAIEQQYKINQAVFSGEFSNRIINLSTDIDAVLEKFRINNLNLFSNKTLVLKAPLHIDKDSSFVSFEKGSVSLAGLNFNASGKQFYGKNSQSDIQISGTGLNLVGLLKLAPGGVYEKYKHYKSDGIVSFTTTISGKTGDGNSPVVEANFGVRHGKMVEPNTQIAIERLAISGLFRISEKEEIVYLKNITGLLGKQPFFADLKVDGFSSPNITSAVNGRINLHAVKQFFQLEIFESLSGTAVVEAELTYLSSKDLLKVSKGSVSISEVGFKFAGEPMNYSQLEGELILQSNDAALRKFSGRAGTTPFLLNGLWRDFMPLVLGKSENIILEAEVYSSAVNLDEIMHRNVSESATTHSAFTLPPNVYLNLKFTADRVVYSTFKAEHVYTRIMLTPKIFKAENIQLELAEGRAVGSVKLEQQHKNLLGLTANTSFDKINIARFFSLMDNFGQSYITHKNLQGIVNGTLDVFVPMDSLLTPDKRKLISSCTFTVNKGKLIQLSTLKETAEYLDKNKMVKPFVNTKELKKKLEVVDFASLTNTISIKDEVISIPEMEIKSSVMDLTVKGNHKFNDSIDYALNFRLRDVLVNKRDAREAEYGYIVDDGLGYRLFLRIAGTVNTPLFSLDKEERQEKLKQDLQKEKQDLKAVLKQELGLFKKDTTLKYEQKPKEEVKFEVKWEDEPTPRTPSETDKQKKEKNPDKGLNKLMKKFGEPEPKQKLKVDVEADEF